MATATLAKIYIFHGDEYVRHSFGRGPDPTYPKKIREFWSGWPSTWHPVSVDAALYYPGNNRFYLFHGDEYVRHAYGQGPDLTYPKKIQDSWSGWPSSWGPTVRINAAFYYPGNDKFYIFHGDEYVRHSYGQGPDLGYPKKIREVWSGWPDSWTDPYVQAALYDPANDKIYLFQNDDYVRHSYRRRPDPEYPKEIDAAWSGWPREEWRDPPGEHLIRIDAAVYYPGAPHREAGTLECVMDVANVRDFGATGDGVMDDTTAIRDAIVDRLASGGTVCFPTGDYRITSAFFGDEPISRNIRLLFQSGARLAPDAGVTVKVYSPENIMASPRQQIHTGEGALAFHVGGTVYVPWWNADAGDCKTLCSAAFQSAIDSLPAVSTDCKCFPEVCEDFPEVPPANGGTVFVPAGYYRVAETIRINRSGIEFVGATNHGSVICYTGEGAALELGLFSFDLEGRRQTRNITVRRLRFTSDSSSDCTSDDCQEKWWRKGSCAIAVGWMRYFVIEDCWFQGRDCAAISVRGGLDGRISDVCIDAVDPSLMQSTGCYEVGIELTSQPTLPGNLPPNQITIDQCYIEWTRFAAIRLEEAEKTVIRNCLIQSNLGHGICYNQSYSLTIHDCYFEDNGRGKENDRADIYDQGTGFSEQVCISNNHFSGGASSKVEDERGEYEAELATGIVSEELKAALNLSGCIPPCRITVVPLGDPQYKRWRINRDDPENRVCFVKGGNGKLEVFKQFWLVYLDDTRGCTIKEDRIRSVFPCFYVGYDCLAITIHDNLSVYDPSFDWSTHDWINWPAQVRFRNNRHWDEGSHDDTPRWTAFRDDDIVGQNPSVPTDITGYPATVTPDARRGRFVDYGVIRGPVDILPPLGLTDGDTIIIQWKQEDDPGGHEVRLDPVDRHYRHGTPVNNAAGRRNTFTFIYDAEAGLLYELSASTDAA